MSVRRSMLGLAIALGTGLLLLLTVLLTSHSIWLAAETIALNGPISKAGAPRPDSNLKDAQPYHWLISAGLSFSAGLVASILILNPNKGFARRTVIYFTLLALAGPITWLNFGLNDLILPRWVQWLLNLYVIAAGLLAVGHLLRLPVKAPDLRLLKWMTIALLYVCAVTVPSIFVLLWLLDRFGLPISGVSWAHITGTGALVSAIIAILNYRRELQKDRGLPATSEA